MSLPRPQSTAGRYIKVKALLFEALEREPSERRRFLDGACQADAGLLDEVLSLLGQIDQLDGFLEERVNLEAHAPVASPLPAPKMKSFGDYRVLELIGYGGMGMVYLAEQRTPRRRVALKVLRNDCADELARKRFEREADVLGRLRHTGIAQIYEAGVQATEAGSMPYFAMEYVQGESILDFANRVKLRMTHAFALIAEVGDALQHAHDKGVLHRDLKPGNILVSAAGEPKLLDFGVALVRDDRELAFRTRTGQLLGTIAYMSPEQARGEEIDERSDQFSLAVILYELLTGRLPFDTETRSLPELVRSIVEDEPRSVSETNRHLRGDPHTLVHKALSKDPRRRYPSVAAFAADLRRYTEGRPIQARPPSAPYRLRRLVGRHRGLALVAGGALLTVIAALSFGRLTWQQALAAGRRASLGSEQVLRLTHARMLDELTDEEGELWPAEPRMVPALDGWLARASELRAGLPGHRTSLAALRALGSGRIAADPSSNRAWGLDEQEGLVAELEAFTRDDPPGLAARVAQRRQRAAELLATTVEAHAQAWSDTIEAIGDVERYPAYRGLRIEAQVGLVPLGPDPESGLFEFALHGPTGTVPERDSHHGQLRIADDTTLIFVLLPGGRYTMGAQFEDPAAPNFDPSASPHEVPTREVELAPFFMSKYELTQGQWVDFGESPNPSYWEIGSVHNCSIPFGRRNPAEHMGRTRAVEFLRKLGCELPTEAQWEYAARGGTTIAYGGHSPDELRPLVNARGRTASDPYGQHGPVGSFPPNPFGLHDVLGNVWELCRDDYKLDHLRLPLRPGDGLVLADGGGDYSMRGGCYSSPVETLRIGWRCDARATGVSSTIGVRPARRLSGDWSFVSETEGDGQ